MINSDIHGFTIQNWKKRLAGFPREDSYDFDVRKNIACVADQVTRDFIDGNVATPNLKGLASALTGKYPHYHSADIFTEIYMKTRSFGKANDAIWSYNKEKGLVPTDYLAKDLAGCTAAGVFEEDDFLHWQFICDAGIAIVNKKGELKFKTPDEGPHSKEKNPYLERILKQHGGFANSEGRVILRSKYRNVPNEKSAYGVLTGEKESMSYVKTGKEKIDLGDYILLYTDGIGEIIFDENGLIPDFSVSLKRNNILQMETFCKKRVFSEGTLVIYRKFIPYHSAELERVENSLKDN